MKQVDWPDGRSTPAIGLGTWHLGESTAARSREVAAIRLALDIGYRVVDTAEMYGEGGAEDVVGQAIAEALRAGALSRDDLFVVTKVYPHNASRRGTPQALDRSLKRLGLDHVDLYLLHWPGSHPLHETVEAFEALRAAGRIHRWGVSNFDVDDMAELMEVPRGDACATDQVYHSLGQRAVEFALLPWLQSRGMPSMAYSPLDQGDVDALTPLHPIAERLGVAPSQVALARLVAHRGVMAIPKAMQEAHLRSNLAAGDIDLSDADIAEIDRLLPPPTRRQRLPML